MGKLERRLLLILSTLSGHFLIGYGQEVSFEYTDHCYNVGDTVTMKAVYKGGESVQGVQWYYSGKTGANMVVDVSNCDVFGEVPDGYPERSRMSFDCQAATKTYTLSLTGLKKDELEDTWGAKFSTSGVSPASTVQRTISECETTTTTDCGLKVFHNCEVPDEGGVVAWVFISIAIAALVTIAIILILKFVFDVKFPCRILNCENMRTSPNCTDPGSKTEKTGKPQQPKDEENQDLTKTRPPAKLDQLNEPGSEKHHFGGRPLPDIGKYN